MNILHVLSGNRWNGQAEAAAVLVSAQRRAGARADLVCGRPRGDPTPSMAERIARKGIDPFELELPAHFELRTTRWDLVGLREIVLSHAVDLLHAHGANGWLLSAWANRRLADRPLLVGSIGHPAGPDRALCHRLTLNPSRTDGVIVQCSEAAEQTERRFNFPADRIAVIEPAVDMARLTAPVPEARRGFGVEHAFVVGMVAPRVTHRWLRIVLGAITRLAPEIPELRILLIGGGNLESSVGEPARRAGLSERIVPVCSGRDETRVQQAYAAMDTLLFLPIDADRCGHSVREAMAAGVPVITSQPGVPPHLVRHEISGLLAPADSAGLANAVRRLCRNPEERRQYSAQAREDALRRFDPDRQAERTLDFYDQLRGALRPDETMVRAAVPVPGLS